MADPETLFPRQFPCNGIDYFLFQLDRIMFRNSGKRNICTFVVELEQPIECAELEHQFFSKPAFLWISSLRIRQGWPFTLTRWCVDPEAPAPKIIEHLHIEEFATPLFLLGQPIDAANAAPFHVDLVQISGHRSLLVFSWHHALMDAHGAERFIHSLGTCNKSSTANLFDLNPKHEQTPLLQRAKIAGDMKRLLYATSEPPLLSLYRQQPGEKLLNYSILRFTRTESETIALRARRHGAGFLLSTFYLAASACAVASVLRNRNAEDADMLIPVPQDRRRRGSSGPQLGNQVTFLFYRIPKTVLSDLRACTAELIMQITNMMREEIPGKHLFMMDLLQRLPGPLYRFLLLHPTGGLLGSFFYSDTGDTLQDYESLFNRPVLGAIHYPPNVCPPGITLVYSRFRGQLQITLSFMQEILAADEVTLLLRELRYNLLGAASAKKEHSV